MIELFIGGCRSGKSTAALHHANQMAVRRKIFIATCRPLDAEMDARIARHRRERDKDWETFEEPLEIAALIRDHSAPRTVILVDCLTLWLTNLILADTDDAALRQRIEALQKALSEAGQCHEPTFSRLGREPQPADGPRRPTGGADRGRHSGSHQIPITGGSALDS